MSHLRRSEIKSLYVRNGTVETVPSQNSFPQHFSAACLVAGNALGLSQCDRNGFRFSAGARAKRAYVAVAKARLVFLYLDDANASPSTQVEGFHQGQLSSNPGPHAQTPFCMSALTVKIEVLQVGL